MYFHITNILNNTILEGPISKELKDKYKDKVEIQANNKTTLGIKTDNNFIHVKSENDIEKTLNFIKQVKPIPTDISEILADLDNRKDKPKKMDLIRTGLTDFVIQFLNSSDDISTTNSINTPPILYSTDKNLAEKLKVPFPGFLGFNSEEQTFYRLPLAVKNNINTLDNIISYISLPLLGPVKHENIIKYESVKIPIFYMLIEKDGFNEIIREFKAVACELKNEAKIGLIEYNEGAPAHKTMATKEQLPTTVIQINREKVYLHNSTPSTFIKFFSDYKEGKLELPIKEEQPVDNTNKAVKIAVRQNADELIKNKEKDVLVVFYAHWCGFCKTLMPELEIIGEKLRNQKTVDIVKVDLALNDLPQYQVSHYPFIRLYKAKTNEEVDFTGTRNTEEILKFIKDNSYYELNLPGIDVNVGEEKVDL